MCLLTVAFPTRRTEGLHGDRGQERGEQHAANPDKDCERACQQRLRGQVAIADRESGDEGKVDRLLYRPTFSYPDD